MITRYRNDFLAANLLAVPQSPRLAPNAEIPKEMEDVIGLNGSVETVADCLIHFLDVSKRSITGADYVAVPEMKICRGPYVRHVSCELPRDLALSQWCFASRCGTTCCAQELPTLASTTSRRLPNIALESVLIGLSYRTRGASFKRISILPNTRILVTIP